ncbi:MAG TPA: GNAT family N-acetyltransferase, partial [Devosia sp.]|nr:GNAT family N-acetyltransferase [Devosia sp.]
MTYTDTLSTPAVVDRPARATAADERYLIEVHERIDQVSPEWPRGGADTDARCHAFQTVTFLETWQATYGLAYGVKLCLVEVRESSGKPLLMIPLMINRQQGSRVLAFTDFSVSDYNSPILFPTNIVWTKKSAAALWQQIVAHLPAFDLVIFDKMPEKVRDLVNPLFLLSDEPNAESCHLTNLDQPVADIEKAVRGIKTFKRHFRGLQRLGECEVVVATSAEQRQWILDNLLEQKQRRFEETNVPGFEKHPEKRDFFALGTETFAAIGALHLSALVVNGQVIATTWGLTQGRHYYGLFL